MWSRLAEHAHLVAIDLPGFGHSEGRPELMTGRAMGEFVAQAIDEFQLDRPHAVGPDIGVSTLLFAAANHPSMFRSIVIGNGTAAVPIQIGSVLKDVVEAPNVDALRAVDPRDGVNSVLQFVEHYQIPEHVREDFIAGYQGDRFVDSVAFVRAYPQELPVLAKLLGSIDTPVQIITGDHDPGVLPVNGTFLSERLPHNKHDVINSGHFAWADNADDWARLTIDWWNGGFQNV
jgi:pimeloyl-ACP methyl ester carboxylesterase